MQNESQKHDLNSYPFLRHRESFMLFSLNSKYRSNSVITLRFTCDEKHISTKDNTEFKWTQIDKHLEKKLIVQQIEKLRRKLQEKHTYQTERGHSEYNDWFSWVKKNFFTLTEDNNGPNAVTKVDNSDYVRRRWELIITWEKYA